MRGAYLICTNPRSGSWLLAEGLRGTGVAGRPEEYVNPRLRDLYRRDLGLPRDAGPERVLEAVIEAGTTANGIFGAKVHRMHFGHLIALLRAATGDGDADEISVLTTVFPRLVLLHHDRRDRVGQALSWYRALATDNWWHVRGERDTRPDDEVDLDVAQVAALEERLRRDDAQWRALFARAALPVVECTYEDLTADYAGTVRRLAREVGGSTVDSVRPPRLARQSDARTGLWRERYLRERTAPAPVPSLSVVIVSHNEGGNLLDTVAAVRATTPEGTQLIVVDDRSTDGSVAAVRDRYPRVEIVSPRTRLGVAGSRNAGAARATGDIVVFSDAHVEPREGWFPSLARCLADPTVGEVAPAVCDMHDRAVVGYGFTWPDLGMGVSWLRDRPAGPAEVPFVCGCFLAMRRAVFEELGGFDDGLVRWGSEDAELSLRVWRRGLRCLVVPDAVVAHLFRSSFTYEVGWEHTVHNMLRVAHLHLPEGPLGAVLDRWRAHDAFPAALARLDVADVRRRRERYAREGARDTLDLLSRFGIPVTA